MHNTDYLLHTGSSGASKIRSAPRRGWDSKQEIQLAPVRPPISLKRNSVQVHPFTDAAPDELKAIVPEKNSAWSHISPQVAVHPHQYSRSGSKNSMTEQKSESHHSRDSSDDLTFYQVGVNASPVKQVTIASYDSSQDLPLPPISRQTSNEAKRQLKMIRKGTIDISSEMSVDEILIEILRVAVNLKIRSTEQSAPNTVKCTFKDITFTVTVIKETRNMCKLSFQWLSGGDHTSYMGVCDDMLSKLHL